MKLFKYLSMAVGLLLVFFIVGTVTTGFLYIFHLIEVNCLN